MSAERPPIEAAIQALESQRAVLGNAVVDLALAPLQQRLSQWLAAQQPREAEATQVLRQVSILFLDAVGSTTLAQHLDPEDVSAVMDGLLARGTAIVEQHGGRVLQYAGDNILAAFGAEAAHEDDAERAVLCGLALLALGRQLGEEVLAAHGQRGFNVRVGVHTGGVLLGGGVDAEGSIRGSAVNIAARMEQTAPSGSLRISPDTYAMVRGLFEVEPQPLLDLKGLGQPLVTWLVRAARGVEVERGIEGLAVPLVGRRDERAVLAGAIQASARSGLQAVTVVAGAGLGKTRLLREALAEARAAGAQVLVVRAHPGSEMRPWGLLNSLLSAHCGIQDGDTAEQARGRLLAGLLPRMGAHDLAGAQCIGQLVGLDFGQVPALQGLDARALRDLAFAALLRWLAALCSSHAGQALVLVFEDLHWADEASLGALAHWWERAPHLPLVLLMSTRPELLERHPGWCQAAPTCQLLRLHALADADRNALADALLQQVSHPPAALRELLVGRAEGNPFYMEELLRRLLDEGAVQRAGTRWTVDEQALGRMRLPTTLVGLLQARLDALPPAERRGAQRASIVGHVFWDEALAQVDPDAPQTLAALQKRQWVRPHPASAFEGTAERQFDHHLLHQVTYDTLLKPERRRGHAAVARWLAGRTLGRTPEFLAVTAEHAEKAGDAALAISSYQAAAHEAEQRFANALAINCLQKALRLTPEGAAERMPLLDKLLNVLDKTADQAGVQQVLDDKRAVLALHPNPTQQAWLAADQALLHDRLGRLDQALEQAQQAVALARTAGAHAAGCFALCELCWLAHLRGDHPAAQAHLSEARALAALVRDTAPLREVQVLQMAGILAGQQGQRRQAVALLEESVLLAERSGRLRAQVASLEHISNQLTQLQDYARALSLLDRMLERARTLGDRRGEDAALGQRAHVLCQMGRPDEAAQHGRQAVEVARSIRNQQGLAGYLQTLGKALSDLHDAQAAWQAFDDAWQWLNSALPGTPRALAALALRSAQDLALGRREPARAGLQQVQAALGDDPAAWWAADGQQLEALHACWQVMAALGDPRAAVLGPLLAQRAREQAAALAEEGRSVEAIVQNSRALRLAVQAGG